MTAGRYDLTTLDRLKAWLQITSSDGDAQLQRSITNVSRFILSEIGRPNILPADYTDSYDGYGWTQSRIALRNWPVISVAGASIAGTNLSATTPYPTPNAASPPAAVTRGPGFLLTPWDGYPPGGQQFLDVIGWTIPRGPQQSAVAYRAGYAVSAEAATVPVTPGPYTVTAEQPFGRWASNEGVRLASSGSLLTAVTGSPGPGEYSVASTTGVYTFNAAQQGAAVLISYGYVPADLEQAALEMISLRMKSRDSIGINSKSLGGAETVSYTTKDMTAAIKTMLQPYRAVF